MSKPRYIRIVESVLGRELPKGAEVHHVDGNIYNESNSNFVVCQDRAYHMLMHVRTRARAATGNANARKCEVCKQWDVPENLSIYPRKIPSTPGRRRPTAISMSSRAVHPRCSAALQKAKRAKKPFDPREFEGQESPVREVLGR